MTEKKKRKIVAARHINHMRDRYPKDNADLVHYTRIIDSWMVREDTPTVTPHVMVAKRDTVTGIIMNRENFPDISITALNFASFLHPGGGFLNGAKSQEEDLCHASNLYIGLESQKDEWYSNNIKRKNSGLYADTALYSKNVIFEKDERRYHCDVITCAAPNKKRASKTYSDSEIFQAYRQRVQFIFNITNSDILILGAWGCGAFGNNPNDAALAFHSVIEFGKVHSNHLIFTIPDDETYQIFKRRLLP